jgi:hypothetical protein
MLWAALDGRLDLPHEKAIDAIDQLRGDVAFQGERLRVGQRLGLGGTNSRRSDCERDDRERKS